MSTQGFGLLGMSVWRRLLLACLLLGIVWLSYWASVSEGANLLAVRGLIQ